jgi:protein CpxP
MLEHRKVFVMSMAVAAGLALAAAGYAQTGPQAAPPAAPAANAQAQAPPSAGPPPAGTGRGQGRGAGMGPQGQPGAGPMGGLNLTQAQRDQVRALRETQRKDAQALREKMRAARQQLQQAMRADIPDEAAVRSAAGAVAALQADQAALQARSRAQMMKVLTPEQQARVKDARARTAQRAQRAMRAERRMMMQRSRMMRPGPGPNRGWGPGMDPMGAPMRGPGWRQQQLRRQQAWRWWDWI